MHTRSMIVQCPYPANAERHQARGQVAPLQLIQHGAEQHRAGGADRMAGGGLASNRTAYSLHPCPDLGK